MKEVIYDYEEFKNTIDTNQPIHHCGERKCIDKYGVFFEIIFRIFGIHKKKGHIVVFEARRRTTIMEEKNHQKDYLAMAEKWAKPLGSTEGELIP